LLESGSRDSQATTLSSSRTLPEAELINFSNHPRPARARLSVVTIDEAREAVEKARKAVAFITRKIKSEKN